VGLIEVAAQGIPYVVEATPKRPDGTAAGVIRVRYADWLKSYTNIQVWHGRFSDLDAAACRRVLNVARSQLGKPYDFFNFDLNDDRSFYCSKLVWLSVWRAAKIAADDNPDPRRGQSFQPWRVLTLAPGRAGWIPAGWGEPAAERQNAEPFDTYGVTRG
jgi:cell wall-associated NlpC family hydrolase